MIVTGGREHALRYFFGVRNYIEANGYTDDLCGHDRYWLILELPSRLGGFRT